MGKVCWIWVFFFKVSNKETVGGDEQFWFIWGHSTTGWMSYKTFWNVYHLIFPVACI